MSKLHISKFGKGPNLVLLHGWGSSSKIWQTCVEKLRPKFRVWCVDLPGHGESHAVKWDCSIEQGLELLAQSLPQTCSIVGWSLGGLLAQLFAKQFPERVAKLMLIASTPKFIASTQWPHGMHENTFTEFSQQFKKTPQQSLQNFCALQVLNAKAARQTLSLLKGALSDQQKHIEKIQWGLQWLNDIDLRDDTTLNSLHIELLHGENDQVSSINAAKQTVVIWKNTKLEQIANAGHAPFISHSNYFLQRINSGIKQE